MKKRRVLSGLLMAFLIVSAPAYAQDSDVSAIRAKAEQGDATAQNSLGYMYDNGLMGLQKDRNEAIKWYTNSAKQGNTSAQGNLCSLHATSLNLLKDVNPGPGKPLAPIQSAEGAKEDIDAVMKWCGGAADVGLVQPKRYMGLIYAKGAKTTDGTEVVKQNNEQAYFWLSMGRKDAFRQAVADKLTPDTRTKVEKKAKDWKPSKPPEFPK